MSVLETTRAGGVWWVNCHIPTPLGRVFYRELRREVAALDRSHDWYAVVQDGNPVQKIMRSLGFRFLCRSEIGKIFRLPHVR